MRRYQYAYRHQTQDQAVSKSLTTHDFTLCRRTRVRPVCLCCDQLVPIEYILNAPDYFFLIMCVSIHYTSCTLRHESARIPSLYKLMQTKATQSISTTSRGAVSSNRSTSTVDGGAEGPRAAADASSDDRAAFFDGTASVSFANVDLLASTPQKTCHIGLLATRSAADLVILYSAIDPSTIAHYIDESTWCFRQACSTLR